MSEKQRYALISVSDKTGVVDLARELAALGFQLLSTGGTARALRAASIEVQEVSEVTGFPEILGGRVKTLHPKIFAGILARRELEKDLEQLDRHGMALIDLVVVNLYPFAATIAAEDATLEQAIENIDIGGPSMVRAAAKNYRHVAVVVNPSRYAAVVKELRERGALSEATRLSLAAEAFRHTAHYDALISGYLTPLATGEPFSDLMTLTFTRLQELRYGENPQQRAAFYAAVPAAAGTVAGARQLQGKPLSYNNINDVHAAWEIALEFDAPAAVAVKHTNPCGVGTAANLEQAYAKAWEADPVSIFGGIVACNREVGASLAQRLVEIFLEVVVAPSFAPQALEILRAKKDLRVLQIDRQGRWPYDLKSVSGGLLIQERDTLSVDRLSLQVVTGRRPTAGETADLLFANKVVKHVKSNAIVVARDGQTLGIGAGQMNRVGAARIALQQAGERARGAVLASDAFFPFKDTVEAAAAAGIAAIIQPGGSLKDQESIDACHSHGIAMVFTNRRYFKH